MNTKEIGELRRRLRPGKNNIPRILGCYVNEKEEILSRFEQNPMLLPEAESEKYLALFKRCLSGGLGKNLLDISFTTQQVADSDEHRLLMALRGSRLQDEGALAAFYERVIGTLQIEGNFLILLACDVFDVPYRSADGEMAEGDSERVYEYFQCAICPVKPTKPGLSYFPVENVFHDREADWVVSAPQIGFLFPAFDDRSANIYDVLYYTHDVQQSQSELIDTLFRTEPPMPAARQRETFQGILQSSLGADCKFEVVQSVHDSIARMTLAAKEDKEAPAPVLDKQQVSRVLQSCGVPEMRIDEFQQRFDEEFGEKAELPPSNLVDEKQFELRTPSVVIKVDPEHSDLVETRIINGCRYILIDASEGVEVNGVNIQIEE